MLLLALAPRAAAAQDVSGEQVRRAVARGVHVIKQLQQRDGTWPERFYKGGETCLATLALLNAGESADDPEMALAIEYVRRLEHTHVYCVSLKILVLAAADAKRYQREIQSAAKWLISAQLDSGLWTYGAGSGIFDHSNSQFALLGLYAAAQAGVAVPPSTWQKARARVLATQNADGGWGYRSGGESYGSMTAAGIADLIILGSSVAVPLEKSFRDGVAPECGKYIANKPLANGLNWIGRNFSVDGNPGRGKSYLYYWLYAVERVGILSGRRYFGQTDWYRKGAAFLLADQNNSGGWGAGLSDTALAVLFLAKGHKPILVQKLQWSANEDDWNPDRHDVENLVGFIGDAFGEQTAWQVVSFDAPLEEWLAAPLLYMQGHRFPALQPKQKEKIRRYVEQGGTLFVEACCGREDFRRGFQTFAAEVFAEYPLRELDDSHPLYSAHFDAPAAGLMGIDLGCRTSIIFSPRDLSCLWEQAKIPLLSEQAFRLGTNIAAFALGRQGLRDRLDVVTLPTRDAKPASQPAVPQALQLAQVVYDGDWAPDPSALVNFAAFLQQQARLDVVSAYRSVRLSDADLYAHPILYMTGHYALKLGEREQAALASHLRRGGFLFADACCGREAFDQSFRRVVAAMFPGETFARLPTDHVIFRGEPGFRMDGVRRRPVADAAEGVTEPPELWGLVIDGRLVLAYSPLAIGCGLDGHKCFNCLGLIDEDARRLAANAVLYALTH